ncbi:hypothetical protein PR048_003342 [Dryococelus australis]|uniref:Uncharacterized protein n=1 Tax=Dryococelus australis TaxID=614101 RepID=A0ABQ9INB3_9NEOP|nr:hypothetical protein PR048_003342 [Dryococelus australis]
MAAATSIPGPLRSAAGATPVSEKHIHAPLGTTSSKAPAATTAPEAAPSWAANQGPAPHPLGEQVRTAPLQKKPENGPATRSTIKMGKCWNKMQDEYQFTVAAPNEPTCYPYNTNYQPDNLDVCVSNIQAITDMEVKQELSSDHVPIIATLTLTNSYQPYNKPLLQTDWEKYEKLITSEYAEFQNHEITGVNIEAKIITDTIKYHIKKASTKNHSILAPGNKNQEIERLIKERNKTRRHCQKLRTQQLKNKLDEFNREIRRKAEAHKLKNWETAVEEAQRDQNGIWKLNCRLTGKKSKTYTPVIHGGDGIKYEAQEKAETTADSLEKQFEPHHYLVEEDLLKETRNLVNSNLQEKNKFKPRIITSTEVAKILKNLPNNKAPGGDSIPNEAAKRLPPQTST